MDIPHRVVLSWCHQQVEVAEAACERGDVRRARLALAGAVAMFLIAAGAWLVDLALTIVLIGVLWAAALLKGARDRRPAGRAAPAAARK